VKVKLSVILVIILFIVIMIMFCVFYFLIVYVRLQGFPTRAEFPLWEGVLNIQGKKIHVWFLIGRSSSVSVTIFHIILIIVCSSFFYHSFLFLLYKEQQQKSH